MQLKLSHIVRKEQKHHCINDERRKTNYILASYIGDDGQEYRKSFESYYTPFVPEQGENKEISKLSIQY